MVHADVMPQIMGIKSHRLNCMAHGLILAVMPGHAGLVCRGCRICEGLPSAAAQANTATNKLTSSHVQPRLGCFAGKFGAVFEPKLRQLRRCSAGKADSRIGAGSFH